MTTAQVVETSVTVNNNSPIQDCVHPDDQTQPTFEMTPGFKPNIQVCWNVHSDQSSQSFRVGHDNQLEWCGKARALICVLFIHSTYM